MELKDCNIDVVLIEPGWINTNLGQVARDEAEYSWRDNPDNPYHRRMTALEASPKDNSAIEGTAQDVARTIVRAVEARKPKARYKVTAMARVMPLLTRWLPTRLADSLTSKAVW